MYSARAIAAYFAKNRGVWPRPSASSRDTGKPSRARLDRRRQQRRARHASTSARGTPPTHRRGPESPPPRRRAAGCRRAYASSVAPAGALPPEQIAVTRPSRFGYASTYASPPRWFSAGFTTGSSADIASAASKALPPRRSTSTPVCDTSGCSDATMPCMPSTGPRICTSLISGIVRLRHASAAHRAPSPRLRARP